MHISYLFHLCIRGDVQLRNAVLMCISSLIKPRFNLIYGRYLHQPHCGPVLNTISLHISPISVSMATYEFDKHSLLFTCLPNPFLIGSETKMIKSDLQLWRELFHKVRQCFRASFTHAQGLRGEPLYSRQEKNVLDAYRQLRDTHPAFPEVLRDFQAIKSTTNSSACTLLPLQADIVAAAINAEDGHHILSSLPTGMGKTLPTIVASCLLPPGVLDFFLT